jgi:hypothetical protein
VAGSTDGTAVNPGSSASPGLVAAGLAPTGGSDGTPTTAGAQTGAAALAPGITATTVSIGILTVSQAEANAYGATFGVKGLEAGDVEAEQQAAASYINAHGGVAGGRKLTLVPYNVDPTASQDRTAQAACQYWTEDHKVFAGIIPRGQVENAVAASCLAQHRTLMVTTPFVPGNQDFFNRYGPYYYAPNSFESIAMGRTYADGLYDQGFFTGKHKLGLLYYDIPSMQQALKKGVLPALARRGVQLSAADTYAITYASDSSQNASTVSAVQSATLRMRTDGVDRVMFLDAGAGLALYFATQAESQSYHPRYGYMSGSNPSFLELNLKASQLSGALAVGWVPTADVATASIPGSPARTQCRKLMDAAGQRPVSENDLAIQYHICAVFFLLRDGLNRAASLTADGFQAAVQGWGSVPELAVDGFGESYAPGKHWGTSSWSAVHYVDACGCFRYYGSPRGI